MLPALAAAVRHSRYNYICQNIYRKHPPVADAFLLSGIYDLMQAYLFAMSFS